MNLWKVFLVFVHLKSVLIVSGSIQYSRNWIILPTAPVYRTPTAESSFFVQTNKVPNVTDTYLLSPAKTESVFKNFRTTNLNLSRDDTKTSSELRDLNASISYWYKTFRNIINEIRVFLQKGNTHLDGEGRRFRHRYKRFLLPLLMAYKLKFLVLIPVFIGGLILLVGSTGLAGFFFALFAAALSLRVDGKLTYH